MSETLRYYCTLFDKNYLSKGLAMIDSLLVKTREQIKIHVLALDKETEEILNKIRIGSYIEVTPLNRLFEEDESLKHVPRSRTYAQFCWTLASYWQDYLFNKHNLNELTYLDSDLFFFGPPEDVFEEMADADIAIVPHRFPKHDYDRLIVNGRYNVSWVTFRRMASWLLNDWKVKTMARCDAETCGDQKYLDDWPVMANMGGNKLHELSSIGMGAGPWNGYTYLYRGCQEGSDVALPYGEWNHLTFYHFHEFKKKQNPKDRRDFRLTGYEVNESQRAHVYEPYIDAIIKAEDEIERTYAKGL